VTASQPLRKLRYSVATSLDGFIAGPRGEYDWIAPEPSFDDWKRLSQFANGMLRVKYSVILPDRSG
jgi:hypothetical protein